MNYIKEKIAKNLHVPEMVDVVRVKGTEQMSSYTKSKPYMCQTLPASELSDRKRNKLLSKIRRIAQYLDNALPHSPIPLGLDSLLGFIPIFGGSMAVVLSLYQVYVSTTFGIPLWLFMQMLLNIAVDFLFSLIPVVGGFLHMFYKANVYNYEALRDYVESPEYLEKQQLKQRKQDKKEPLPGEITWTQLGADVKEVMPNVTKYVPNIKQFSTTTSAKKRS